MYFPQILANVPETYTLEVDLVFLSNKSKHGNSLGRFRYMFNDVYV